MNTKSIAICFLCILFVFSCKKNESTLPAYESNSNHNYTVNVSDTLAKIQSTMYGIFFEDINFGADGGIYAELIKNRSFEFTDPMMGWEQPASDRYTLNTNSGFAVPINYNNNEANSKYLKIEINSDNGYSLTNNGFRGIGYQKGAKYLLSFMAKQLKGSTTVHAELIDSTKRVLATVPIKLKPGNDWQEYACELIAADEVMKGKFNLRFEGKGLIELDMVSLFPAATWMNRPKGLRADLVQLLADMKPGFVRFPGGCIVEGMNLERRYQWKKTIGKIADRKTLINRWNTEFAHRPATDYFQSFGMGFYEYFLLSEDIGAEPLPILNCGMACQFNTAELVPLDEIQPYIDDALDLIEFANGPVTSKYGKIRAEMGHAAPFNMKYIGIGNEQWGPEYFSRYELFERVLKAKYPAIKIVSSAGPFSDGEMFEYAMGKLKSSGADLVDEHYYKDPKWFLDNANRYDRYDRKGPKIFAGEYAAQSVAVVSPQNKNNWECALAEAAFMTGLERNADVVHMSSYAPLFAHAEGWQWTPDLIWFNNLKSYGTPNYYIQKLFSNYKGSHLIKILEDNKPIVGSKGLYSSAVWDHSSNSLIVKIVNSTDKGQRINIASEGKKLQAKGKLITLSHAAKDSENSFEKPKNIVPKDSEIGINGDVIKVEMTPLSMAVVIVGAK